MDFEKFQEIIDFAIEREVEAVKFYQDLQRIAKLQSSKDFLFQLELMEKGHIKVLENITIKSIEKFSPIKLQNLQISDYMVNTPPYSEMSYQDVLMTAMKKEEAAVNLYSALAGECENPDNQKIFLKLAEEESKHKLMLETIYDDEILKEN